MRPHGTARASCRKRAEQARRGLLPLRVKFGQLIGELYAMLQMDLDAGPAAVAPFFISLTSESRLEDG